jgi:RHS repeat-associated protein
VLQDQIFYPWGQSWHNLGTWYQQEFGGNFLFDPSSSLYTSLSRTYNPTPGRWLSPDPGGANVVHPDDPQTWNMYAYVRNNPVTLTDPSGLCTVDNETHNWVWCVAHHFGITSTQQERRDWVQNNVTATHHNGRNVDWSTESNAQINRAYDWGMSQITESIVGDTACAMAGLLCTAGPGVVNMAVTPFMTTWGWNGSPPYKDAVNELREAGTHETLNGKVPTKGEAIKMIEESGGRVDRIEEAHGPGSVSTHDYPHINYTTEGGVKATVKVQP